jgi:hypothetical protein
MTNLGEKEWQSGWRILFVPADDVTDLSTVMGLCRNLIAFVGMTPDGPPDVRFYPTEGGKGGQGIQIYQPLVESWLVISTWPAHGFTRINLSSCKQFDHGAVTNYLSRIGEVVEDWQQKI